MLLRFYSSVLDFASAIPALAARHQARAALDARDLGKAADGYALAEKRLGNQVLAPIGADTLFPDNLRQCALAASRLAREEGQPGKREIASQPMNDHDFRLFVGAYYAAGLPENHIGLTDKERILLATERPLEGFNLLGDLFEPVPEDHPHPAFHSFGLYAYGTIGRLFYYRYRATLAREGDAESLRSLAECAIHSDSAYRLLRQLSEDGISDATGLVSYIHSERHSIFKYQQRMLEEEERRSMERMMYTTRFL